MVGPPRVLGLAGGRGPTDENWGMGTGSVLGNFNGILFGRFGNLFGRFGNPRHAQDLLSRIGQRWNGASTVLRFRRFSDNHVGSLADEGVGADVLVQSAWAEGYRYDPERVARGLHMSL